MEKEKLMIQMALHLWTSHIKHARKLLVSFSETELWSEVSPGRNRGVYLFGHLAAYHDLISEIMGTGTRAYPEMQNAFILKGDKTTVLPLSSEVLSFWDNVHNRLSKELQSISVESWFANHEKMSNSDFLKEPHRNRLNVLLNRTAHLSYHLGQIVLLNK